MDKLKFPLYISSFFYYFLNVEFEHIKRGMDKWKKMNRMTIHKNP